MQTIVFLTGRTGSNVFENIALKFADAFRCAGFDARVFDFSDPQEALPKLKETLASEEIYFAFGFIGFLKDLTNSNDGSNQNFWQASGIPYIGMHGDSPAYFFDRHSNEAVNQAMLYGFPDHYMLRKKLPHADKGVFGVMRPYINDREPIETLDFKAKEQGKLFFLKNGNDPQNLIELWQEKFPYTIFSVLMEMGEVLVGRMHKEAGPDIDKLVVDYFLAKGIDITALTKLRLFYVAQLDDYLRRVKSTMMAEVLSDFPVEIHGVNWDHMDFTGKKCNFVGSGNYLVSRELMKTALGVIDMSPNTTGSFHDRPLRAYGMHTLCLTTRQDCMTQTFGADAPFLFDFSRESLSERVADILAHPKRYVEIGIEAAHTCDTQFTEQAMVYSLIEIADALRLGSLNARIEGMQNFFVWPPLSELS